MLKWWKGECKSKTSKCESCPKQFIKDNQMDEKIKKKKVGMGKVMCWKRVVALKTQKTNE